MNHSPKAVRLVQIYQWLSNENGLTSGQIARRCSRAQRTAQRDIQDLESLGCPIYLDGDVYRLASERTLPRLWLDVEQVGALLLGQKFLESQPTQLRNASRKTRDALGSALAGHGNARLLEDGLAVHSSRSKRSFQVAIHDVLQSIEHRHRVRCFYRSFSSEPRWRQCCPLQLFHQSGAWCLLVSEEQGRQKTLRLDRIETYELLPELYSHTDLYDVWPQVYHGSGMARALQEGLIDEHHSLQLGIRASSPADSGLESLPQLSADWLFEHGAAATVAAIRQGVDGHPVYLSFDIDFLDPAYAPGTGTPVIGGPTTAFARQVMKGLLGLNVVGGDVVEVSPPYDNPGQITALAGASMAFYLLELLLESRSQRG